MCTMGALLVQAVIAMLYMVGLMVLTLIAVKRLPVIVVEKIDDDEEE